MEDHGKGPSRPQAASALTALAIVLGVTFVTGTLVLGDTLNRTFDTLIGTAYQHVSFQIRGKAAFNDSSAAAIDSTADRKPIPQSLAAAVRRLPGVAYVYGSVAGYAQFVAATGRDRWGGGSALGFSFDPNPRLSAVRLVAGKAPTSRRRRGDGQGDRDEPPLRGRRPGARAPARRPLGPSRSRAS